MVTERVELEQLIRNIIAEKLSGLACGQGNRHKGPGGIISVQVPKIKVCEDDRMETGKATDKVYTKDLFSLEESQRLGCGIMEMSETTFDWTLLYDEVDYVIEGTLSIIINGETVTAHEGEIVLIPKNSKIKFSVPGYARFIYVTYPADWASQ